VGEIAEYSPDKESKIKKKGERKMPVLDMKFCALLTTFCKPQES